MRQIVIIATLAILLTGCFGSRYSVLHEEADRETGIITSTTRIDEYVPIFPGSEVLSENKGAVDVGVNSDESWNLTLGHEGSGSTSTDGTILQLFQAIFNAGKASAQGAP